MDAAPLFPEVLRSVEAWLKQHNLLSSSDKHQLAFATDGYRNDTITEHLLALLLSPPSIDFRPWDFANFLRLQCHFSELPYPRWARKWINVRKEYSHFYTVRPCGRRGCQCTRVDICAHWSEYLGIEKMLLNLGLTFDGRRHSGLDDSINIARIALALIKVRILSDDLSWTSSTLLLGWLRAITQRWPPQIGSKIHRGHQWSNEEERRTRRLDCFRGIRNIPIVY